MAKTMLQAPYIYKYNLENKPKFNPQLFDKRDEELIEVMTENLKSLERDQNFMIKVLDIYTITDYEEIEKAIKIFQDKIFKVRKEDLPPLDKILLADTEYYLMVVRYFIKTNNPKEPDGKFIEVPIILPKIVDKYYFKIDGQYYYMMYQVADYSYYNNNMSRQKKAHKKYPPLVIFSTLSTPAQIEKVDEVLYDINGEEVTFNTFNLKIFKRSINVFKYTAAKMGMNEAMLFHNIHGLFIDTELPNNLERYHIFKIENKKFKSEKPLYIYVDKFMFESDPILQSDTFAIINVFSKYSKPFHINNIYTRSFWVMSIGIDFSENNPTIDKANNIIKSLDGIYDIRTFAKLRLPDKYKQTIYHILLWIMREYESVSVQDRISVDYKRVQWAEYVAFSYTYKINETIYRLSDRGLGVKLESVEKALTVKPNHIISKLKGSKMPFTAYRDLVNDLDSITALKYTFKDYLSTKGKKLAREFSDVHISHMGRLDPDSSPKSDPGMSGILTPMCELYGPYRAFKDFEEPNTWRERYTPVYKEYMKDKDILFGDKNRVPDSFKRETLLNEIFRNAKFETNLFEDYVEPDIVEDEGDDTI